MIHRRLLYPLLQLQTRLLDDQAVFYLLAIITSWITARTASGD